MRRALAFLTPVGRASVPNRATLDWFPLVGAAVGMAVGGAWWAADRAWAPIIGAAIAVVADAAFTGCLHLDGLADAADGLLPPMETARRFEVLRDPSVGAFGATALISVLLLRFACFAVAPARPLVVAGLWCGSRTGMAVITRSLTYTRTEGGLATAFTALSPGAIPAAGSARSGWTAVGVLATTAGLGLAAALVSVGLGLRGVVALGGEAVGLAGVAWLAHRRIGGFTGDVLGAAGVIGETLGLLVMAAR